jgi:hypothetical protein
VESQVPLRSHLTSGRQDRRVLPDSVTRLGLLVPSVYGQNDLAAFVWLAGEHLVRDTRIG